MVAYIHLSINLNAFLHYRLHLRNALRVGRGPLSLLTLPRFLSGVKRVCDFIVMITIVRFWGPIIVRVSVLRPEITLPSLSFLRLAKLIGF